MMVMRVGLRRDEVVRLERDVRATRRTWVQELVEGCAPDTHEEQIRLLKDDAGMMIAAQAGRNAPMSSLWVR